MKEIERTCANPKCQAPFTITSSKGHKRIYCSEECMARFHSLKNYHKTTKTIKRRRQKQRYYMRNREAILKKRKAKRLQRALDKGGPPCPPSHIPR
jgi:hypothetical protein